MNGVKCKCHKVRKVRMKKHVCSGLSILASMGPVFRTVTVQTGAGIHVQRDVVAVPPLISLFSSREKDRVFQVGMQEHTK